MALSPLPDPEIDSPIQDMETSPVYKSKNPSSYTSQSYKERESNEEKYYTSWKGSEHTQEPKEHEKESEDIPENNRKFFDALPVW